MVARNKDTDADKEYTAGFLMQIDFFIPMKISKEAFMDYTSTDERTQLAIDSIKKYLTVDMIREKLHSMDNEEIQNISNDGAGIKFTALETQFADDDAEPDEDGDKESDIWEDDNSICGFADIDEILLYEVKQI